MIKFNIDDFDIINIEKRGEAELQINKRYMTFTRSLLEEMGCPPYVRMLIKEKDGIFAVQECKRNDENAYRFSRPKGEQKESKYCSTFSIKSAVIALMGNMWNESEFYGCKGTYFPDDKAMVFQLKDCYVRNVIRE